MKKKINIRIKIDKLSLNNNNNDKYNIRNKNVYELIKKIMKFNSIIIIISYNRIGWKFELIIE
jgi:hypothetical protein